MYASGNDLPHKTHFHEEKKLCTYQKMGKQQKIQVSFTFFPLQQKKERMGKSRANCCKFLISLQFSADAARQFPSAFSLISVKVASSCNAAAIESRWPDYVAAVCKESTRLKKKVFFIIIFRRRVSLGTLTSPGQPTTRPTTSWASPTLT